jgi:hypothetical protein
MLCADFVTRFEEGFMKRIDDILNEFCGKTICCDQVFALFAIYVSRYVSKKFYSELILFLGLYRITLNEKGWEKFRAPRALRGVQVQGRVLQG